MTLCIALFNLCVLMSLSGAYRSPRFNELHRFAHGGLRVSENTSADDASARSQSKSKVVSLPDRIIRHGLGKPKRSKWELCFHRSRAIFIPAQEKLVGVPIEAQCDGSGVSSGCWLRFETLAED